MLAVTRSLRVLCVGQRCFDATSLDARVPQPDLRAPAQGAGACGRGPACRRAVQCRSTVRACLRSACAAPSVGFGCASEAAARIRILSSARASFLGGCAEQWRRLVACASVAANGGWGTVQPRVSGHVQGVRSCVSVLSPATLCAALCCACRCILALRTRVTRRHAASG